MFPVGREGEAMGATSSPQMTPPWCWGRWQPVVPALFLGSAPGLWGEKATAFTLPFRPQRGREPPVAMTALAFSPDGKHIASGSPRGLTLLQVESCHLRGVRCREVTAHPGAKQAGEREIRILRSTWRGLET